MGDERKELGSLVEQFEKSTGMKFEDGLVGVFNTWRKGYRAGQIAGINRAAEIYREEQYRAAEIYREER